MQAVGGTTAGVKGHRGRRGRSGDNMGFTDDVLVQKFLWESLRGGGFFHVTIFSKSNSKVNKVQQPASDHPVNTSH